MKYGTLVPALLLAVSAAAAQDRIPDEEAKKAAALLVEASAKVKAPLPLKVDPNKPYGKRRNEYGALVIPAQGLEAKTIEEAGDQPVAVGQIYFRGLAPVVENKVLPSKRLIPITVSHDGNEIKLGLCYVAVQKVEGKPTLLLFGEEKKPLLTAPLEKADEKQELPIEFRVTIEGEGRATVNVVLLGSRRTSVEIGVLTE
jgi:hypothetical protein